MGGVGPRIVNPASKHARQPCSRGLTPTENIPVIGVSPKGPARQCNVPDLAAGTLPMEAGSSTVPGPMTGMEIDGVALQLQQAEVCSDQWCLC